MVIQVIEANQTNFQNGQDSAQKLKVAAYCRVSTDMEEQESSYEAQCEHYTAYIHSNDEWIFAGIYADEGISGTSTKRRTEFKRMIHDCEEGRINLILTKSISRFSRNTLDCLQYIRKLKALNIAIFFEKENINTLDAKGEVLITIMASIAQQESQSISQNVRIGIQYRMMQGKGRLNTSSFMGLTKDEEGNLIIIPEEADIIRRIYREYLDGYSPAKICKHLERDGIKTKTGKEKWYPSTITSILENEKYCGDLLLQKYYTEDFLTHKIVKNEGKFPKYYIENNHEPIIPKEIFQRVQEEKHRRSHFINDPTEIRYGSENILEGRIICGICKRTYKKCMNEEGDTEWCCCKRKMIIKHNEITCGYRAVTEKEMYSVILNAFNQLPLYKEYLTERWNTLKTQDIYDPLEKACINHQIMQIYNLLEFIDLLNDEKCLYEYNHACYEENEFYQRTKHKIPQDILKERKIIKIDHPLLTRYLKNITVQKEGYEVMFKAGMMIFIPAE